MLKAEDNDKCFVAPCHDEFCDLGALEATQQQMFQIVASRPFTPAFLHASLLGFGWKRVAINSGPKEPKGHVKEKMREPITTYTAQYS
ncbi:hypothetical protein TNCV_3845961 [Trichonephila clavipes]|nr:hypothetical protein TNCV_3845961 [Trichonephila clavipes]